MQVAGNMEKPEKNVLRFLRCIDGFRDRDRSVSRKPARVQVKFSGTGTLEAAEIIYYMEKMLLFMKVHDLGVRNFMKHGRKSLWLTVDQLKTYTEVLARIGKKSIPGQTIFAFAVFYETYLERTSMLNDEITIDTDNIPPDIREILQEDPLSVFEMASETAVDTVDTVDIKEMPAFMVDSAPVTLAVETEVDLEAVPAVERKDTDRWEKYFSGSLPPFFVTAIPPVQQLIDTVCRDSLMKCPGCGVRHVNLLMLRDNEYGALYGCVRCGGISYDTGGPDLNTRLQEISHFNLWIKLILENSTY